METKLKWVCAGVCCGMMIGVSALAADIGTRSTEDAYADLMRTWQSHGGKPAGFVKTRSSADCYADMIRDWDGRLTQSRGTLIGVGDTVAPGLVGGDRTMLAAGFGRR